MEETKNNDLTPHFGNTVLCEGDFIKPPLSYQGGKGRIAFKIVDIIDSEEDINSRDFFHDFCSGSGAISIEVFNRFPNVKIIMYDISPMGLFYKMVKNSSFDLITFENEINKIPKDPFLVKTYLENLNKTEFNIYKFLILQAGSFGGKQINYKKVGDKFEFGTNSFRNYWQPTKTSNRKSPVNPMMPMPLSLYNNVKSIVNNFKPYEVYTGDLNNFKNGFNGGGHIFYIDPPYDDTSKYTNNLNNSIFYSKFKEIYVSEYKVLSSKYWEINKTNKGGISGNSTKSRVELLNKITFA